MRKSSLNTFVVNDKNEVLISRDTWERKAITTYREDYYDELSNLTWTKSNGYLEHKSSGRLLHRYIMEKWHGVENTQRMLDGKEKWIIEHMNNLGGEYKGFDNRIQCLTFASHSSNIVKAFTIDMHRSDTEPDLILHIFFDISVNRYQVSITFTVRTFLRNNKGEHPVKGFRLLYGSDFDVVINEATAIIFEYKKTKQINIDKLRFLEDFEPVPIELPYLTASGIERLDYDGTLIIDTTNPFVRLVDLKVGWDK